MNEQEFLKGQRVVTPDGQGEVTDAIGDKVTVKLDSGTDKVYPADDLQDDSSAG
ncbi:hypothetical protein LX99_03018 [Mucilaginibacter oryzae]|uniref:Hypervirulence associated protein TUDOR domain-containing protein n=1 Tax=Mucilaginibacter oryzae TaxID=468058 RepID=A0A316H9T5_9SPHI|nr:hypothetical protein [Mucilaginibacter oryzae]PWK77208.1 hypothetical protein LX99_03018 [Mucilaginibacter oryzae]